MTLEELIYGRLEDSEDLKKDLTKYNGSPAIFLQKAPDDTAQGWAKDKAQYPRLDYLVDYVHDPERHSSGMITVNIYSSEEEKHPEDLAPAVREALTDVILQTDDRPYAIAWDRTELFELKNSISPDTLVNGAMLTFLLIAFPSQETRNPDPVKGLQEFLHLWDPDSLVIGRDQIEDVYEPSDNRPAFYCRVMNYRTARETFALRWIDCQIAVHVIAPSPEGRAGWTRYLADSLDIPGEVTLLDGSPMLIDVIEIDNGAEYLTRGQLTIKAQYSIPVYGRYAHPLKRPYISDEGGKPRNG